MVVSTYPTKLAYWLAGAVDDIAVAVVRVVSDAAVGGRVAQGRVIRHRRILVDAVEC